LLSFFAGAVGFDAAGTTLGLAAGVAVPGGAFADDCATSCAAFPRVVPAASKPTAPAKKDNK
jgi:hypothetical protein